MNFQNELIGEVMTPGKYQIIIIIIATLSFIGNASFIILLPTMSQIPDFQIQKSTETMKNDEINKIILFENNRSAKSELASNKVFNNSNKEEFCSLIHHKNKLFNSSNIEYKNNLPITWASELYLICNSDSVFSIISTIYFLGSLTSNIAFDSFPDKYGRRKIFILLNIFSFLSSFQLLFLKSIIQILIAAFFMGFATFNLGLVSTIITENFDYKYSAFAFTFANSIYALSGVTTVLIIYFLKDWHYQHSSILLLFFISNILSILYMHESPKWLAANHKFNLLKENLIKISKINGNGNYVKEMLTEKYINLDNNKIRKKSSSVKERKISNQLMILKQQFFYNNGNENTNLSNVNKLSMNTLQASTINSNYYNYNITINNETNNNSLSIINKFTAQNSINNSKEPKDNNNSSSISNNYKTTTTHYNLAYNNNSNSNKKEEHKTNSNSNNINLNKSTNKTISKESDKYKHSIPLCTLNEEISFLKQRQLYSEDNNTKAHIDNKFQEKYSITSETSSYEHLKQADFEEKENTIEQASCQIIKIKNYTRLDLLNLSSSQDFTIKNIFLWAIIGFSYYGVFLNMGIFSFNIYITAIVSFLGQFVGLVISGYFSFYLNRKNIIFYSFFLSGTFSLLFIFLENTYLQCFGLFLSVACLCSAANVLFIYSCESYPTNSRSTAINLFILSERLSSTLVSFLLLYVKDLFWLSSIFCCIAAIFVFTMPESEGFETGDELPEFEHKAFKIMENEEDNIDSTLLKKFVSL